MSGLFPENPAEVEEYRLAAERSMDLALAEQESLELLHVIAGDLERARQRDVPARRVPHPMAQEQLQWRGQYADSNCVEVAHAAEVVGVRDSKNTDGSVLLFAPASWSMLVDRLPE